MNGRKVVCLQDIEDYAIESLPKNALEYARCGSDEEQTLKDNIAAFKRWKLLPRVLIDVSGRELSSSVLGHRISFPVCQAASAMHKLFHPEGEMATAAGCAAAGTIFTLSMTSTTTMEDIHKAAPNGLKIFQMNFLKDRAKNIPLIRNAEKFGYIAIIVTIDVGALGKKRESDRFGFNLPSNLQLAFFDDTERPAWEQMKYQSKLVLEWSDIEWLRSVTKLPIILKGTFLGDDIERAIQTGVAGIVVSNHGGRALDSTPATIDILPDVLSQVNGRCEVYIDGGVRTGTVVIKALAMGAKAVFVGRPAIYGLAYNGKEGVRQVFDILREELSTSMALCGCVSIDGIDKDLLRHENYYLSRL